MKEFSIDLAKVRVDEETGIVYVGKCPECGILLTGEEMAYGHDCEAF